MGDSPPHKRLQFHAFKFHIVDWKWEYMEKAFLRLAEIIDLFLDRLDIEKIKRPMGQRDNAGSVGPQALAALHAAKAR
eukprot:11178345-Lingulodinium_polyedra.AAC.1